MPFELNELRCPKCTGELALCATGLSCTQCDAVFPVNDHIIDFRCGRRDYYFNPVPIAEMEQLIRGITPESWPSAIRTFLNHVRLNPGWLDNLVADGRYAWKLLLNLNRDTVLLDLGCGLGNLTKNVAPHVARVYAMDLTYQRLEFAKMRFEIFNPSDNIQMLAAGDAEHLPFAPASIDCVIVSGVLEWVGEGDMSPFKYGSKVKRLLNMLRYHFGRRNARAVQLRFLEEIRRILKHSGQLYVAIENRLNWEYFTGRPDHHSALKFGSLLPRFIANFYSILINRKPYRTYTYSIAGYRRLFKEAGFHNVEFLGLSKGYSFLEEILPCEVEAPRWLQEAPRDFKNRVKRSKYFVPAYGIIAGSSPKPWPRLQDGVFAKIEQAITSDVGGASLVVTAYKVTAKDKLIIVGSVAGSDVVIKIPCNAAASTSETRNFELLQYLGAMKNLCELVPRPLAHGDSCGVQFFVESRMHGEPLKKVLLSQGRTSMLAEVSAWLEKLSSTGKIQAFAERLYDAHVTPGLSALTQIVDDRGILEEVATFFRERLYGMQICAGVSHGDFGLSNIFVTSRRITGLIDWEAGSSTGLPVLDAINYLWSVHHLFDSNAKIVKTIPLLASWAWPAAEEVRFLTEHYARCGVDTRYHEGLVYLNWLHVVAFRAQYRLSYDPREIDVYVTQVLKSMLGGAHR